MIRLSLILLLLFGTDLAAGENHENYRISKTIEGQHLGLYSRIESNSLWQPLQAYRVLSQGGGAKSQHKIINFGLDLSLLQAQ